MLRKSGSVQKDQNMADAAATASGTHQMNNNNSVFRVAGLFLGQGGPKALSDCDASVMSPTSPLDLKKFSTSKVGLSIVDSLDNNNSERPALDGKNIVFGPQLRIRTSNLTSQFDSVFVSKSLPTTDHQLIPPNKGKSLDTSIFEIADDALESEAKSEFIRASCPFSSSRPFIITSIPKSNLHISGCTDVSHLSDFLSFCNSCSKELAGKDIYIYRGEKAFCSPSCRELEMEDDDKMEDTNNSHPDCTEPEP